MLRPDKRLDAPQLQAADERRYYREWCVVALLALSTLTLCLFMQWGQSLGLVIYDQFVRWWPAEPGKDIVVVAVDDHTLQSGGGWPIKRTAYAQLLRKLADSGNTPLAIGFDILFPDPMPEDPELAEQMRRHRVFLASEQPRAHQAGGVQTMPAPPVSWELARAAQGLTHVNLSFEQDGALRGTRLVVNGTPQLALAMSGLPAANFESHGSYRRLHLVHPQIGFPTASLADVLSGEVPLEFFKDKYLLVGATAPSLGDHFPTLFSGQEDAGTPGVMLHANLLQNLLQGQAVTPVPLVLQLALAWLSLTCALVALLVLSPRAELLVSLTVALCTLLVSLALLVLGHQWFDPGLCFIAMVLLKPVWAWRRNEMILSFMGQRAALLQQEPRQRQKLRQGLRLRHFTSDTLLQYSRMLDKAIGLTQDRLSFLQRLVAQVPIAMLVTDEQGRILLANPGMQHILPAELLHQGESLQRVLSHLGQPADDLERLARQDHLATLVDPKRGDQYFILRMAPIDESTGNHLWVLSLADVTEMRQFQTQRERTLQLLSHDMRTPIASIIALSRQGGAADVQAIDIHRQASTLLGMMDDFIYSIQAQATEYKRTATLLDTLVDEALYQVKELAQARNMHLLLEESNAPLFVQADPRLLTRVLVNLLVNAVRHGQPGTDIAIRITQDPVEQAHPMVRCTIANTVAARTDSDHGAQTADTGKSFGLGLEFVKTVVHKHDGQLHTHLPQVPGCTATVQMALPFSL